MPPEIVRRLWIFRPACTANIAIWYNARTQGQVAGANMAGALMEFDANVLVNLAHYLDYDFISIGDVAVCRPEDRVYEYEDDRYYIRAVAAIPRSNASI